jgi:hypothetical protein
MNKKQYIPFIFLLFIILTGKLLAQEVSVFALMDTAKIRIGEQVKIDVFVNYKSSAKKLQIQWPAYGDTLRKEVEVVNVSKIDTTIPDKSHPDNIQQHQTITITSFDSGFWALQPFRFIINGDTSKPTETQALLLEVQSLPVDTAEASIKDIKTTFDEPANWKEYLPFIYWGVGILAAIIIAWFLFLKFTKKKPVIIAPPKPQEPPHLTALRDLESIRQLKLWQQGKTKEFYTAITDTLRVYLEGRYGINAMELTTDEIMAIMRGQVIDALSKEKLLQILSLADYVKFAKAQPIDVENELSINNAVDFVRGTLREEVIVKEHE